MEKQRKTNIILSIIIVSYNTKQITKDCLQSIFNSIHLSHRDESSIEIIVVDNNSTDGSIEMIETLKKQYSSLILLTNEQNLGFGKANNKGIAAAQGRYILLLNSDIIVLDTAIEKALSYYKDHEETIHFMGGKLLNKDMTPQPSCGPFFSLPVIFGFLFLKGDHWGLTRYSPEKTIETDWVSGACILTQKKYMNELGGFDEDIFMYMEEVDLLFRAKQKGLHVWFHHASRFIHLGSASSKKSYPIIQAYKGFLYFYHKHYGKTSIFILKCMLQLKAIISVWVGIITRNTYLKKTYGKAYQMAQLAR